jgi:asparagine synthase (glutamine-hydrolysing)
LPNDKLKFILKSITHKYVPKELVDRPKKGFALPIVELFRNEFIDYLNFYLNEKDLAEHNLFSIKRISFYKEKFIKGDNFYANKLWAILMFQMWYKNWIDGESK